MTKRTPSIEQAVADLLQGKRPAVTFGICDSELESIYAQGHRHYQAQRYQLALRSFARAALLDPLVPAYQLALGACYQQLGEYEKAIRHYGAVAMLSPDDLRSLLHTAECLLALGRRDKARECLDMLLEDAASVPGDTAGIEHSATTLLAALCEGIVPAHGSKYQESSISP